MLRPLVLWVLSEMARERQPSSALALREALGAVDPLVRPLVRARVRRAVAEAVLSTTRALDEGHAHRLAYLAVAGRWAHAPDDVDAVRLAFAEAAAPERPPRGAKRLPTILAASLLVLIAVAAATPGVVRILQAPPELPPSRGAYRTGGRPEPGGHAVRAVFAEDLAAFTIALDRVRSARGTPGEAAARAVLARQKHDVADRARRALGPFVTSYLRAVLDQSVAIVQTDELVDSAIETHVRSVDSLDASLQSRGLGIYVDAQVSTDLRNGQHRVYLSSFTVEHVALYRSGKTQVRALQLRRLDPLNFEHAMLGFTRDEIRDALVLLDRVEEHMVRELLPALGDGAPMRVVSSRDTVDPWRDEVEQAAGRDVRAEASATELGATALAALGAVYTRRRELFETWARRLGRQGIQLRLPDRYQLDLEPYAAITSRVPADEWRQAEQIADELSSPRLAAQVQALEAPLVASIERHEVQHRLDFLFGASSRPPPAELAAVVVVDSPLGQRSRAELSAYLAELARDAGTVKTNLALLSRYLLDPDLVGHAESYAALLVFDGLGRELRVTHPPLLGPAGLDRAAAARTYLALRGAPAPALRAAAARLWAHLFGRPLPPLRAARGS